MRTRSSIFIFAAGVILFCMATVATAATQTWGGIGTEITNYTGVSPANPSSSQFNQPFCSNGRCTYTPLEPLSGFSAVRTENPLSSYLSTMFRVVFSLGGMFAVVMLVVAGVGYMVSESGIKTSRAKERATAALLGMALLASSWLILYVINPELLRFNLTGLGINVNFTPRQQTTTPGSGTQAVVTTPQGITVHSALPGAVPDLERFKTQCEGQGKTLNLIGGGTDSMGAYTEHRCQ